MFSQAANLSRLRAQLAVQANRRLVEWYRKIVLLVVCTPSLWLIRVTADSTLHYQWLTCGLVSRLHFPPFFFMKFNIKKLHGNWRLGMRLLMPRYFSLLRDPLLNCELQGKSSACFYITLSVLMTEVSHIHTWYVQHKHPWYSPEGPLSASWTPPLPPLPPATHPQTGAETEPQDSTKPGPTHAGGLLPCYIIGSHCCHTLEATYTF